MSDFDPLKAVTLGAKVRSERAVAVATEESERALGKMLDAAEAVRVALGLVAAGRAGEAMSLALGAIRRAAEALSSLERAASSIGLAMDEEALASAASSAAAASCCRGPDGCRAADENLQS